MVITIGMTIKEAVMNKKARNDQARRLLDKNLNDLRTLSNAPVPKSGWVRAIREALGMTREQLGNRMYSSRTGKKGITASAVQALERQEAAGTVTISSLERAAEAMGCSFTYAFIPASSLDQVISDRAQEVSRRISESVKQTMSLENQEYETSSFNPEMIEQVRDLRGLWND